MFLKVEDWEQRPPVVVASTLVSVAAVVVASALLVAVSVAFPNFCGSSWGRGICPAPAGASVASGASGACGPGPSVPFSRSGVAIGKQAKIKTPEGVTGAVLLFFEKGKDRYKGSKLDPSAYLLEVISDSQGFIARATPTLDSLDM